MGVPWPPRMCTASRVSNTQAAQFEARVWCASLLTIARTHARTHAHTNTRTIRTTNTTNMITHLSTYALTPHPKHTHARIPRTATLAMPPTTSTATNPALPPPHSPTSPLPDPHPTPPHPALPHIANLAHEGVEVRLLAKVHVHRGRQAYHIVAAQHHMAEQRAKARAQGVEEAKGIEVVKNGNICKGYRWTQELAEVTVSVDLPPGAQPADHQTVRARRRFVSRPTHCCFSSTLSRLYPVSHCVRRLTA